MNLIVQPKRHRPPVRSGPRRRRSGFTIVEILAIMLLLAVLSSLLFPALQSLHRAFERRRALAESRVLAQAALAYRSLYSQWPLSDSDHIDASDEVILFGLAGTNAWLSGSDVGQNAIDQALLIGALTTNRTANPRRELFIEIPHKQLVDGRFVDPWGQPYIVLLRRSSEHPLIGTLSHSQGTISVAAGAEGAVACSAGPPGRSRPIGSWELKP